jgi:diguanylate cyclase (GGDEF)-like protein
MRQLRRYIEAKYGNRIHAIPKLSQLFFLDFVRAFVDMYCSLLEDEESFPRRTGERVPVAGDAERTVWKQEQQHRGRAASELLHIRLKEEQESGYLDGLTGLRNKEYYLKKLQSDYAEIRKRGLPVSLMMLDIDHFKWINDEFGHPKGDEVLSDIGQTIQEHIRRSNDVPIRYGGEEVLILFQAPVHTALLSAERLRDRQARHLMERELYEEIRDLGARHEDSCGTLSVGVVDASRSASLEEAIGEADKALYRAKQDRNRAVLGRKDNSGALQLITYEDYAKELRAKRSSGGSE